MTVHPAILRARRRDLARGLLWISPWLVGFALFMLAPAVMSLRYSLADYTLLEPPVFIGLANYRELLGDRMFRIAVQNTLLFGAFSVIGTTLLSVLIAVLLEQRLRGAALVRAVVFAPTLVPIVSACVTWGWLFNAKFGLINSALAAVGIDGPDWLGTRAMAMPSLILMSFWVIGTSLMVCSAALKDVPVSLYEAADLDGVPAWRRFWNVTLPMISPAVMFNAMMSLIWSLQVFAPPQIMTRGGPENSTLVYSMYVYSNAFVYGRMGYACALAWVQLLVTLVLAALLLLTGRRFVYYRAA